MSFLSLSEEDNVKKTQKKISICLTLLSLLHSQSKFLDTDETPDTLFHERGQLAAYPGKIELKFIMIANTFRSLGSQWRQGQAFTKLY